MFAEVTDKKLVEGWGGGGGRKSLNMVKLQHQIHHFL